MPTSACRVCGRTFFARPLLRQDNMPKAAQYLPDRSALAQDGGVTLDVFQCSGCGLVQLGNDPVPYYREVIRAAGFSAEMKAFRRRQFARIADEFDLVGRKIIEIGCGRGEYLSLWRHCGLEAFGVEQGQEAARHCVAAGLRVSHGFLTGDSPALPDAPFDAFCIFSFLEHLPDPNTVLKAIGKNCARGAIGLVEVPNFDMMLQKKLFSEFIGDHLMYFTAETLKTALRINGFDPLRCEAVWHDYILSAIVCKKEALDITHLDSHRQKIVEEIQTFVRGFGDNQVAVWGAGHQALAILSMAGLSGKIRYVVDSAPFKQGRFTPATHIPIVPPETLASDPVCALIVMAAGYCDEVAGIVRQRFGTVRLAILRDFGLEIS